jgi:ABC-type nitrate/sulfonate/bicarbonate transport system substrate-binding protein
MGRSRRSWPAGALGWLVLALLAGTACAPAPAPTSAVAPTTPPISAGIAPSEPSSAPAPPTLTRLRIPYSTPTGGHVTLWYAVTSGLLAQRGLEVESDYIPTSTVLTQGLMAGEYQLASSSQEATVSANLAGSDVVLIAAGVDRLGFAIAARPGLVNAEGLRGGRLGITRFGTGTEFAARAWLPRVGLAAERDTLLVPVGGQPELWAALQAGAIDAAVLGSPLTGLARQAGYPELVDFSALDIPFHVQTMVATRRYLGEQPRAVRVFLEGYAESIAQLRRDPAVARASIARFTGVDDAEATEDAYQILMRSSTQAPRLRHDAVRASLESLAATIPAAATATVEQFVDTAPLDALEAEGVLARLGL